MPADLPNHTIIKIKAPLTFTKENAKEVLFIFKKYWQKIL